MVDDFSEVFNAMEGVAGLKGTPRTGWLRYLDSCESVSDHSFGTAVLSRIIADKYYSELNAERVMLIALFHDIGEAITGDITPHSEEYVEKESKELEAVRKILGGGNYADLVKEYHQNKSPEAQLVRDVDKLEMAFQAAEYERVYGVDLSEFFEHCDEKIKLEKVRDIYQQVKNSRP